MFWKTLIRSAQALALGIFAVASAPSAQAVELDDAAIIAIYNQVNSFDIETALLGELRGESPSVRNLARMVSHDHSGVRKMAYELAAEIGVKPDLPAGRSVDAMEHDQVIAKLRGLHGKDFDKAYLSHEVAFHKAAIAAVRELLLPSAQSPKLKAHFEAVLPAFESHLAMTIKTAKEAGYF